VSLNFTEVDSLVTGTRGNYTRQQIQLQQSLLTTAPLAYSIKVKGKAGIAVHGTPSHSYGVSLAIWAHTVLPSTRHKPARQAGTRFTYPGGMEGWVDLDDLLHAEMVYPPVDGHPSKY